MDEMHNCPWDYLDGVAEAHLPAAHARRFPNPTTSTRYVMDGVTETEVTIVRQVEGDPNAFVVTDLDGSHQRTRHAVDLRWVPGWF